MRQLRGRHLTFGEGSIEVAALRIALSVRIGSAAPLRDRGGCAPPSARCRARSTIGVITTATTVMTSSVRWVDAAAAMLRSGPGPEDTITFG